MRDSKQKRYVQPLTQERIEREAFEMDRRHRLLQIDYEKAVGAGDWKKKQAQLHRRAKLYPDSHQSPFNPVDFAGMYKAAHSRTLPPPGPS